jgi:putative transposase
MSRLRRIEERDRFFFVTTNLSKTISHLKPNERTLILEILGVCRAKLAFKIFAYVVMPDHVHLMIEPGSRTLSSVMRDFKSKSALAMNERRQSRGPVWQSRYFDFVCRRVRDFSEKVEYIHHNPVKVGLVGRPEGWPWSSANSLLTGGTSFFLPDPIDLPADGDTLLWPAPWR